MADQPGTIRKLWRTLKGAVKDFFDDDATTLAASLAFYTVLSLGPLLVILLFILQWVLPEAQRQVTEQAGGVLGEQGAQTVGTVIANARQHRSAGIVSTVIGVAMLLLGATLVFNQLKKVMNRVWDIAPDPGRGPRTWASSRLAGLALIVLMGLLLLASLTAGAVVAWLLAGQGALLWAVNLVVSLALYAAIFAALYRLLPDAKLGWRTVILGAVITGALFVVGRWGLDLYLSRAAVGSPYGAAGSLVVLLVWVYYASLIFLLGAEITQSQAHHFGHAIEPGEHAHFVDRPGARAA